MASSLSKLFSMESFELYVFSFEILSFDLASLFARGVVIFELLLGLCLALGIYLKPVKWLTALTLAAFSAFLLWRMLVGDNESCHCMGDLVDMNPLQSLLKNAVLAVLLALFWKSEDTEGWLSRRRALISSILALVTVISVFCITPPDAYFRRGRVSDDLMAEDFKPVADSLGYSSGRRAVCFYSAQCPYCANSASKMASIIRRNGIQAEKVSVLFMQTHTNQDSVALDFFHKHGEDLVLGYSWLHPYRFLPLTNGAMPLVVLLENGELVKEYDYLSISESEIADFLR